MTVEIYALLQGKKILRELKEGEIAFLTNYKLFYSSELVKPLILLTFSAFHDIITARVLNQSNDFSCSFY